METRPPTGQVDGEPSAKPKVFISYAREDSLFVERLTKDLERQGFEAWFDRPRILGGSVPADEIANAIASAAFFLVVVSRTSSQSTWVRSELNQAVTREKDAGKPRTIPIRLDDSPVPAVVAEKHYIDFAIESYEDNLEVLRCSLLAQPLPPRAHRPKAVFRAALVVVALLLAGALGVTSYLWRQRELPTIAILSFDNVSGQSRDAWVSTALGDMLTSALRAGYRARLVGRKTVDEAERDFVLAGRRHSPADFRRRLGADYVVGGSYRRQHSELGLLIVDCALTNTSRGTVTRFQVRGSLESLPENVLEIAGEVKRTLNLGRRWSQQRQEEYLRSLFPLRALAHYFTGVGQLRAFDECAARRQLEAADREQPNHPLIFWHLASAAWEQRRESEAAVLAKHAAQLAKHLPRREQLEVRLMLPHIEEDWPEVIARYRELVKLAPEEDSFRLDLAEAQAAAGYLNDALASLDALLEQRPPPPRHVLAKAYVQKANVLDDDGQLDQALDLLDQAIGSAAAAGAVYRLAEAQLARSQVLTRLGRHLPAATDLEAAQRTFEKAGDTTYAEVCAEQAAILHFFQDSRRLADILRDLQQLERTYGTEPGSVDHLRVLVLASMVLAEAGRLAEAEAKLNQAKSTGGPRAPEILVSTLAGLAVTLFLSGKTNEATRMADEARNLQQRMGRSSRAGAAALNSLAEIFYYRGELGGAQELQSLALSEASGRQAMYARLGQGRILAARGDPRGREQLRELYDSRELQAERGSRAEAAIVLAHIENLEGRFTTGANLAADAETVLSKAGRTDLVALARATRAWALACQGDAARAEQVMAAAARRSRESQDFRVRHETAITAARVSVVSNKPQTGALHALEQLIPEAGAKGFLLYQFEARLALGEIHLAFGAARGDELRRLQSDARAKGFGQIARLAAHMLEEGPLCKALRRRPPQRPASSDH